MATYILFDTPKQRLSLAPFTFLRPVSSLRCGIVDLRTKWSRFLKSPVYALTAPYLCEELVPDEEYYYINAGALPSSVLFDHLKDLSEKEMLVAKGLTIAFRSTELILMDDLESYVSNRVTHEYSGTVLTRPWQLFQQNKEQIEWDFNYLSGSGKMPTSFKGDVYGGDNIFFSEGFSGKSAVIDAENGPVFFGASTQVEPGATIQGAHSFGAHTKVLSNANLKGDSSFGDWCKAGGEISNSVFFSYSNKGHDGYIGNAVIGEWCNLGAMTTSSNLKNNYSSIRIHSYLEEKAIESGLTFCGVLMGDHTKTAIGTLLNTATVIGIGATIFGSGFHPKFIPSFAWGGAEGGFTEARFDKTVETARAMMGRRKVDLNAHGESVLKTVYETTANYRKKLLAEN